MQYLKNLYNQIQKLNVLIFFYITVFNYAWKTVYPIDPKTSQPLSCIKKKKSFSTYFLISYLINTQSSPSTSTNDILADN